MAASVFLLPRGSLPNRLGDRLKVDGTVCRYRKNRHLLRRSIAFLSLPHDASDERGDG